MVTNDGVDVSETSTPLNTGTIPPMSIALFQDCSDNQETSGLAGRSLNRNVKTFGNLDWEISK